MLLRLNYDNPHPKDIQLIVDCLKNDGLIIYPTDTVYSIGCDIMRPKAIEKLCKLKNIKPEKANFSFVCSDLSQLSNYFWKSIKYFINGGETSKTSLLIATVTTLRRRTYNVYNVRHFQSS